MRSESIANPVGERFPYALPQALFMQPDLVHAGVLTEWMQDDRMWGPQTPTVSFKPCLLSASNGYFVNVLRVRQNGILSRHRHAGAYMRLCFGVAGGTWSMNGSPKRDRTSTNHPAKSTPCSSPKAWTR